jgi:hypothetical protein
VPYAEISARLGIPIGSIGPTRRRCLDKLRRHPAIAALISADSSGPADRGTAAAVDRPGVGRQHPIGQSVSVSPRRNGPLPAVGPPAHQMKRPIK